MGVFVRSTPQPHHMHQNLSSTWKCRNFAEQQLIFVKQDLQETLTQELSRDIKYGLRRCTNFAQYLLKIARWHIHDAMQIMTKFWDAILQNCSRSLKVPVRMCRLTSDFLLNYFQVLHIVLHRSVHMIQYRPIQSQMRRWLAQQYIFTSSTRR